MTIVNNEEFSKWLFDDNDVNEKRREIINPVWTSEEKNQVQCEFVYYENNQEVQRIKVVVSDTLEGNPDWYDIFNTYTVEDIDNNSREKLEKDFDQRKRDEKFRLLQKKKMKELATFEIKADVFEIPYVMNSENKQLKRKIRKAKSGAEALIYGMMIVQEEMSKEEKNE